MGLDFSPLPRGTVTPAVGGTGLLACGLQAHCPRAPPRRPFRSRPSICAAPSGYGSLPAKKVWHDHGALQSAVDLLTEREKRSRLARELKEGMVRRASTNRVCNGRVFAPGLKRAGGTTEGGQAMGPPHGSHQITEPPLTLMLCPVMNLAPSEHKKATTSATSSGVAILPSG